MLQEFIRVGYYVNNEYADLQLREAPPEKPIISQCAAALPCNCIALIKQRGLPQWG